MSGEVVFVLGNEAGDVDSIVSSLLVAYYYNTSEEVRYQAVLPFPAREFRLRRDAVELFRMAGWDFSSEGEVPLGLVFIDQVDVTGKLIITDANKLGSHLVKSKDKLSVVAVYDHHRDEHQFLDLPAEYRIINETAGSCCSVVLDKFKQALPQHLQVLAYGCILLDTRNFTEGKCSQVDNEAFGLVKQPLDAKEVYDKLMFARNDVSQLSMDELMQLDYKQEGVLGFATLMLSPKSMQADLVESAMWKMLLGRDLQVLCAVTSPEANTRGFYLLAKDLQCAQHVVTGLQQHTNAGLLSQKYFDMPLCKVQRIQELGFGLEPMFATTVVGGKPLLKQFSAWTVRGALTRKTMLPAMLELLLRKV